MDKRLLMDKSKFNSFLKVSRIIWLQGKANPSGFAIIKIFDDRFTD